MRILVVEDEPSVADVIRRSLERMGGTCLLAPDARRADAVLENDRVDAVTLDLGLPGIGGVSWLETVADRQPELARRTLVITGLPVRAECAERLARCGAGLLAKPFTPADLQDAVRTQFRRAAQRRAD